MQRLILTYSNIYFGALGRLAPKVAARTALRMFRSPRWKSKVPAAVESTLAEVERPHLNVQDQRIQAGLAALPTARLTSTQGLGYHRILPEPSVLEEALNFLDGDPR